MYRCSPSTSISVSREDEQVRAHERQKGKYLDHWEIKNQDLSFFVISHACHEDSLSCIACRQSKETSCRTDTYDSAHGVAYEYLMSPRHHRVDEDTSLYGERGRRLESIKEVGRIQERAKSAQFRPRKKKNIPLSITPFSPSITPVPLNLAYVLRSLLICSYSFHIFLSLDFPPSALS